MPCFESTNFYQIRLKIKLFLQNNTNFSSAGAPPPDPRNAPFFIGVARIFDWGGQTANQMH